MHRDAIPCRLTECSLSTSAALTSSGAEPLRVKGVAMSSIAARFQMPIWIASHTCGACVAGNRGTPYSLDSSASVIPSRMASSATLALNSPSRDHAAHNSVAGWDEWFFRFFIADHFFRHAIHLHHWSEFLRPALTPSMAYVLRVLCSFFEVPGRSEHKRISQLSKFCAPVSHMA